MVFMSLWEHFCVRNEYNSFPFSLPLISECAEYTLLRITVISVFGEDFQVNRNRRNCYLLETGILCILLFLKGNRLFLEWILQNKDGHLKVFIQCSILNRESP